MRVFFKRKLLEMGWLWPTVLVVVTVLISLVNYSPGTWLTGWDTLHPEFDFSLNLGKVLNGVWRQDQGVGALAGHSHMAELPRIILLWLASMVVSVSNLRYFYVFLSLVLGPLGVYFFLEKGVFQGGSVGFRKAAAFLGALAYLFNLGTVQHFYVPFEMFPTQFAALGWLFWLALEFFRSGDRKWLVWFAAASFFSAPMAYASLLWYAYGFSLGMYLVALWLVDVQKKNKFKRLMAIGAVVFAMNAFWMLPNFYFVLNGSQVVRDAKINRLFSPEAFLQNKSYGTVADTALIRNFLFNWLEYDAETEEFSPLLEEWIGHLEKPGVIGIGYGIAILSMLGLVIGLLKKDRLSMALLPVGIFSVLMLINMNPPFSGIFSWLRENIDIFREGLRNPFTKFSIIYMFVVASYFGLFWQKVFLLVSDWDLNTRRLVVGLSVLVVSAGLFWYGKPMFEGRLVSERMRLEIPDEYFEFFEFMKNKPESARVAMLPMQTMWGWEYYDWGYQGAGFIWFGLNQPVLVRDFDRWSPHNETFYKQASRALYDNNLEEFEESVAKYQVKYLVVDEAVVNAGGSKELLFVGETKKLLAESTLISQVARFGKLTVYEARIAESESFVKVPVQVGLVEAENGYSAEDSVFRIGKDYVSGLGGTRYPLVGVDNALGRKISFEDGFVNLEFDLESVLSGSELVLPDIVEKENVVPVKLLARLLTSRNFELTLRLSNPQVVVNGAREFKSRSITQIVNIGLSSDSPRYVSIAGRVLDISRVGHEQVEIGSVLMPMRDLVAVKLYGGESIERTEAVSRLQVSQPRLCADPEQVVPADFKQGTFSLQVSNESVCLGGGLSTSGSVLAQLLFEAESNEGLFPRFCLSESGKNGCINNFLPDVFGHSRSWGSYEFNIPLVGKDYWMAFVAQAQPEGVSTINYRNFRIVEHPQIGEVGLLVGTDFPQFTGEQRFEIDERVDSVAVRYPARPVTEENFSIVRGATGTVNCDIRKQGEAVKRYSFGSVFYEAYGNGVSCDYFDYLDLAYNQAFLMRLVGENDLGRGLKIYLHNREAGRLDQEELLATGVFDEVFAVLPRNIAGNGYTLNVETRAFHREASANNLQEISFWPLPNNWMKAVRIETPEENELVGNIVVKNVEKHGNSRYLFEFTGDRGVVVLGQGFEPGWHGYLIESGGSDKLGIQQLLPWLGREKLEHVLVNGWSNGFVVDGSEGTGFENRQMVIVYWPQYLEWLGLAAIFVLLGALVVVPKSTSEV